LIIKSQDITGKLTHWIAKKFTDLALLGKFELHDNFNKPKGMWLSWNNGWEDWCNSEQPNWINKEKFDCLNAKLKYNLKLWLIDNMNDFLDLWGKYCDIYKIEKNDEYVVYNNQEQIKTFWQYLVEEGFDGIALSEQGQNETRMRTWLYGWDCCSIIVFNPENVLLSRGK